MSFKSNISKILANKKTLHVVFVISLLNMIGYLVYGNFHAIVLFLLITGVVSNFSKNISIVLLIPLFIVNLFVLGNSTKEGMENSSSKTNTTETEDASGNSIQTTIKNINDKASTKQGLPITPIDDTTTTNTTSKTTNKTTEESFEVGRNKKGKYDIDYASTIEDAYDERSVVPENL